MNRQIRHASVLGAGVMGSRIAAHLSNIGIQVLLLDIIPPELSEDDQKKGWTTDHPDFRNKLANHGLQTALKSNPAAFFSKSLSSRIQTGNFDDNLSEIKQSDWIIEVVVENLAIKKALFEKVEALRRPGTLISTNTSGISVNAMTEGRSEDFKKHFLGTHFFNPPRYLKLLEVIPTQDTDRSVVDFMMEFGDLYLGKSTVEAKDTPDFIGNRIGVFGIMNTLKVMKAMDLTIEEIDKILGPATGRPKSAVFRTADLVGLDTMVYVASHLYESLSDDEQRDVFKIPDYLQKMVDNKWLGDKTGQGFYKKTKNENGETEILSIRPDTLEYETKKKVKFPILDMTKPVDNLTQRLKMFAMGQDKAAEFFKTTTYDLLQYASMRIPEISDTLFNIDKAMKGGFGWELGPFEIWDVLGVQRTVEAMEKAGKSPAPWVTAMLKSGRHSFYERKEGTRYFYDNRSSDLTADPDSSVYILLDDYRDQHIVEKNPGAVLLDIGDGVLCLEFQTKMNTIGSEIFSMVQKAHDRLATDFEGLVIGNQSPQFSAGANLALLLMAANEGDYDEIDLMVRQFQKMTMSLRYSPKPIVVAPHGLTLGGGCEMVLHADYVQAAAETYIGLVEVGVGLIPAGGGTKEMTMRAMDEIREGDIGLPPLRDAFMTMGMGKVATSAIEAQEMGLIRKTDGISMNRDRQILDAKREVLRLAKEGYKMPSQRTDIKVLGRSAYSTVKLSLFMMHEGKQITDYDKVIGEKLGYIMCGGDLSEATEVCEQYLLDLEREAFLSLCGDKRTLERIQHMLKTGKPLRN